MPGKACPLCGSKLTEKSASLEMRGSGRGRLIQRIANATRYQVLACSNPNCSYRRTGHGGMG